MGVTLNNPNGMVWGYARVSTKDQNEDRQMIALEEYGVDPAKIFLDKISGKTFNRPAYKKLIRVIRKGDIIVIKSLDRLGRNYDDIIDQWRLITHDIGCLIHVIDMPILNTSDDPNSLMDKFISNFTLQLLSFVAQDERERTRTRQREGIEAAKRKRKVIIGRPKKNMPFEFWEVYIMWKSKQYKSNDIWRFCHETWGMSNRTFYRRIYELDRRYGDLSMRDLRLLIFDEIKCLEGIAFDNEFFETTMGYFNPYVLHSPEKTKRDLENKRKRQQQLTPEEEEIIKLRIMAKRQEELRQHFGNTINKIEMEDALNEKLNNLPGNKGTFKKLANNHNKKSGIEDARVLYDTKPIIPNIERDSVNNSRTIIIT